jgi:hypothetical protein
MAMIERAIGEVTPVITKQGMMLPAGQSAVHRMLQTCCFSQRRFPPEFLVAL